MSSICGIIHNDIKEGSFSGAVPIEMMSATMAHRGMDQSGSYNISSASLASNRLTICGESGMQPMTVAVNGFNYTIVYNGELYNAEELRGELEQRGHVFISRCDTEVALRSYIEWGPDCPSLFNGMFAFAVLDEKLNQLYLARDRFGIKPLYYTINAGRLMFASEVKALLAHPDVKPRVNRMGLWQLVFLSPVTLIGSTVFRDIYALEPACHAVWRNGKLSKRTYWELEAMPFEADEEEAAGAVCELLTDAIHRQLATDAPLCCLLSGGLDSSIVSSVVAKQYEKAGIGKKLHTFSFEYENNMEFFKQTLFQPQSDDEYAAWLARELGTHHHILTITPKEIADALPHATSLRDFPGQADIDSSLLLYCQLVKQTHAIAMTGEGADEIFGGYPWYYRKEMMEKPFFPWIHSPFVRSSLFRKGFINAGDAYSSLCDVYKEDLAKCPMLDDDSPEMKQSRQATWLTSRYFMASLLERKDRMSMGAGLEARMPFSDHRLLEYVYNVPWEMKRRYDTEKYLLREAMGDFLPDRIKNRKKSPYPKVHNPEYERIVKERLDIILSDKSSFLSDVIDKAALDERLNGPDATWFGQLMGRPQLIAWLLQFEHWMKEYNVELVD